MVKYKYRRWNTLNIIDIINKTKRAVPLEEEEIAYLVNG